MPTLSNVVSKVRRRLNSTSGSSNRQQQPDLDYPTDHSQDDVVQLRNHSILKSLPRPRNSTRKKLNSSQPNPPLPQPQDPAPSDQEEEQPPELRRWSGFKDPFPKVSPGGYKRYYESHGGVPEPKSSNKPLPVKPTKSSSSPQKDEKVTITISQPMPKQRLSGADSASSPSRNGRSHGQNSSHTNSNTSPPRPSRTQKPSSAATPSHPHHHEDPYSSPASTSSPTDISPVELELITTSLLCHPHPQECRQLDLTSTIRIHDEHDADIEYAHQQQLQQQQRRYGHTRSRSQDSANTDPDADADSGPECDYTIETLVLAYDPTSFLGTGNIGNIGGADYYYLNPKKRLSTIHERPSRASSVNRLSAVSHASQGTQYTYTRERVDSAGSGSHQSVHSPVHSRSNSITSSASTTASAAASASASVHTSPSLRLRRRQRQVLRTPSIIRDFTGSDYEVVSAVAAAAASSGSSAGVNASSLHRGPSTSSQVSQASNMSSYANSTRSDSLGSHSRKGSGDRSGSETPPTTVEDHDGMLGDGVAAAAVDDKKQGEEEDVFDVSGLEAVAKNNAVAARRNLNARRIGASGGSKARRRSRELNLTGGGGRLTAEALKMYVDGWEDEEPEDWRRTWYTAKTHFSDDGR